MDDLEQRLQHLAERNLGGVALFASRMALRKLPHVARGGLYKIAPDTMQAAFVASVLGLEYEAFRDNKALIKAVNNRVSAQAESEPRYKAAVHASASTASAVAGDVSEAVWYAKNAAEFAENVDDETVEYDLNLLEKGVPTLLRNSALWPNGRPESMRESMSNLRQSMSELNLASYIEVYGALLNGKSYPGQRIRELIEQWFRDYGAAYAPSPESPNEFSDAPPESEKSSIQYKPLHVHLDDELAEQDMLGRQDLVDALASILADKANRQHLTIGLLGDWGAGKSTFVKLLQNKLQEKEKGEDAATKFLFAEFNAWEYEHTEHMQAGVAREALKGLTAKLGLGRKWKLALKFSVLEKAGHVIGTLFMTLLLLSVMIWGLNNQALLEWSTKDELLIGLLISVPLFWILFVVWKFHNSLSKIFKSPLVKAWKSYLSLPDYDAYLGTIPVMRHQIHTLCQLQLKKHRLLFVVDDLDRCSHAGVVKTFEAVRLIMGIPQVTVIIAIDHRIALASLALHYNKLAKHHPLGDSGNIARDYLGKVIQLPVQLHAADDLTVASFVDEILFNEDEPSKQVGTSENDEDEPLQTESGEDSRVSEDVQPIDSDRHSQEATEILSDEPQKPPEDKPDVIETVEYQLSPAEKTAFKDRVKLFGFHNPRQLKRLYNSFNLLRHLYGSDQVDDHMLVLFWLEYLNMPVEARKPDKAEKIKNTVKNRFGQRKPEQDESSYDTVEREVKPFVLPALDKRFSRSRRNRKNEILQSM